jgi:hypothetical protein
MSEEEKTETQEFKVVESVPQSDENIIYQSALNDFYIIDDGPDLMTIRITTDDGRLRSRYPTSEEMPSQARALYHATKISIKDLEKMEIEQIKEVLRKRNPSK